MSKLRPRNKKKIKNYFFLCKKAVYSSSSSSSSGWLSVLDTSLVTSSWGPRWQQTACSDDHLVVEKDRGNTWQKNQPFLAIFLRALTIGNSRQSVAICFYSFTYLHYFPLQCLFKILTFLSWNDQFCFCFFVNIIAKIAYERYENKENFGEN